MPLSSAVLKASIKAKLIEYVPTVLTVNPVTHNPDDTLDKMAQSIAEAVVSHIVDNLSIAVPASSVVIAVSQPFTINPTPIPCTVS